jgi:hypothetical protein
MEQHIILFGTKNQVSPKAPKQPTHLDEAWVSKLLGLTGSQRSAHFYLPPEVLEVLPTLEGQSRIVKDGEYDPYVVLKYFTPDSNWTWFVVEGEEQEGDFLFFGLVQGFEEELGYFTLKQIQENLGPFGLRIERDLYFKPQRLSEIRNCRVN